MISVSYDITPLKSLRDLMHVHTKSKLIYTRAYIFKILFYKKINIMCSNIYMRYI